MKALSKGTPVRIVVADVVGEIVATMANGDDFGYMVRWNGPDGTTERFFPAQDVEKVAPLDHSISFSASGDKAGAKAQIVRQVDHPLVRDALCGLIDALDGDSVVVSGSITPSGLSMSGSASKTSKEGA